MLEFFRNHRKMMQLILLVLILPSFAFVGLDSYTKINNSSDVIAKVDGIKIKKAEFDQIKKQHFDRLREQFSAAFDPNLFNSDALDQAILDDMITQRLLQKSVGSEYLSITNQRIQQLIESFTDLQENGRFNLEKYKALLSAQGRTPAQFEDQLRSELQKKQVLEPLSKSNFIPKTVLSRLLEINDSSRVISVNYFLPDHYLKNVKIQDQDIQNYYNKNSELFKTDEILDIEYVTLSSDIIAGYTAVSEDEINAYYEKNKSYFSSSELRQVRHILIAVPDKSNLQQFTAAKDKANAVLLKLKSDPKQFTVLARSLSQDLGSAAQGGLLEPFARGAMVKPFEEVAFSLKKGQISDVIETDFGFHIVELINITPSEVKPLKLIRSQIVADIQKQKVQAKFPEIAEEFTNLVFDQSETLKPVVDRFNLKINTAQIKNRQTIKSSNSFDLLNHPEFLSSLFTDEVLKKGHNSKVITINGQIISARAVKYEPAAIASFESVRPQIDKKLALEAAALLAQKDGEDKLKQVQEKLISLVFSEQSQVSRSKPLKHPLAVVNAAFNVDEKQFPAYAGVQMGQDGYALIKITSAIPYQQPDFKSLELLSDNRLRRWGDMLIKSSETATTAFLRQEANVKVY